MNCKKRNCFGPLNFTRSQWLSGRIGAFIHDRTGLQNQGPFPPTNSKTPSKPIIFFFPQHRITKRAPLKRAKLISKHAALLSRLNSKTQPYAASKVAVKRRCPSKKLVGDLDSLADALPTTTSSPDYRRIDGKGREREGGNKTQQVAFPTSHITALQSHITAL